MFQENANNFVSFEDSQLTQCYLCNFSTLNSLEIHKHLLEEHKFDSEALKILSVELLSSKADASGNKNTCPVCLKVFKSFRGMRQHVGKIHDTKNRKRKCGICGGKFKDKYALKYHTKQVHFNATKVSCERCHQILYNKYHLRKHLKVCLYKANN